MVKFGVPTFLTTIVVLLVLNLITPEMQKQRNYILLQNKLIPLQQFTQLNMPQNTFVDIKEPTVCKKKIKNPERDRWVQEQEIKENQFEETDEYKTCIAEVFHNLKLGFLTTCKKYLILSGDPNIPPEYIIVNDTCERVKERQSWFTVFNVRLFKTRTEPYPIDNKDNSLPKF